MYSEIHIPSSSHQSPTFGHTLYKFIVMGSVRKSWPYNWRRLWKGCLCDDKCDSLLRQGQTPKGRWWWPVYWAVSGELPGGPQLNRRLTPCAWPSSPSGARRPANPFRPRWRKAAAAENTFKGLRGENSFGRLILVPSNSLKQLNGALARANSQKTETRSCMVLGLKHMRKLITRDKYLSVRQNQGLAWSSDLNLWEN